MMVPRRAEHCTRCMELEENLCIKKKQNPFCEDRDVYFVCDDSNLIKTARNKFFLPTQSTAIWVHCQSARITGIKTLNWLNGQHISWEDLVNNRSRTTSGLSLLPKLKNDHIYFASYSRMHINLAAQVI